MVSDNSTLGQDASEATSAIKTFGRNMAVTHGLIDGDVIPGDPAEVGEAGEHLSKLGSACERVGSGIKRLDTGDWTGEAAEKFHANYLQVAAPQWTTAADSFGEMGQALAQYAQVLAEQQQRATQAQTELEQAKEQAKAAAEAHNAKIDAGTPPAQPFQDPTAQRRAQAQHTIARAKETVAAAGDRAAATMRAAAARAPAQPGLMAQLAEQASDSVAMNANALAGIATGFGQAVAGLGGLALGAFKAELYFGFGGALVDPEGAHDMVTGVTSTASAAVSSPDAAWSTAKAMVGVDTWKNHPTQAIGEAVPNALAYATGGGGAIAAASKVAKATKGARAGERVAEAGADAVRSAERTATAPESAPRFSSAAPWQHGELPPSVRMLDEPDTPPTLREVPNESTPWKPSDQQGAPSARGERGFDDGPAQREPVGPSSRPEAHHHESLDDVHPGEHHEPGRDMTMRDEDGLTPDDHDFAAKIRPPELGHLSDRELLSVSDYRGGGYHDLNAHLRGIDDLHQPDADLGGKISDLDKALEQVPSYDAGPVYRGFSVGESRLDEVLARYEPGEVVSDPAYTSTSIESPRRGNVQMVIDSQQGRDLSNMSSAESEVLFPRDTPFRVTDRVYDPDTDTWQIHVTDP